MYVQQAVRRPAIAGWLFQAPLSQFADRRVKLDGIAFLQGNDTDPTYVVAPKERPVEKDLSQVNTGKLPALAAGKWTGGQGLASRRSAGGAIVTEHESVQISALRAVPLFYKRELSLLGLQGVLAEAYGELKLKASMRTRENSFHMYLPTWMHM